MAEVELRERTV